METSNQDGDKSILYSSFQRRRHDFLVQLGRQATRRRHSKVKPYRFGVAVFVDCVSKRIHRLSLKEAFSAYGRVLDVYIVYNNPGRINKRCIFAFVRHPSYEKALKAIELANNQKKKTNNVATKEGSSLKPGSIKKVDFSKLTNARSFKEVLMAKSLSMTEDSEHNNFEEVGQVKGMYDANFVEQALKSEGFKVKVSPWSGFFVIIHFVEQEQIQIFWDLKASLLKSWFVNIDTVEHFSSEKKLKVWVTLENLPLVAWNDEIFKSIVSRWGTVLKTDEDTSQKNKFDCARILTGVKHLADVPKFAVIFINRVCYNITVLVAEYEDERRWIDTEEPKGQQGENLADFSDEENNWRFEDFGHCVLDKTAVDVPKTLENEANEFPAGDRDTRDRVKDNHVDYIKHGLPIEIPKDNDSMIEVPIRCDLETSKDSSGSSEPCASTLDKETGLFSIKPKGIKNISVWNTNLSRPNLDRLHAKPSRNNILNKSRLGKSIEKVPGSLVSPTKAKVRKDSTPD
ncbi:hypothetical protein V6N13_028464 [Hibiscus sabdariffa]|uniref:RRM domain-containing protein n=1 Tax=Hibiscus sabdariffa TaxID=183260 RepID=A0ABR2DAB7_9ROSI